VNRIQGTLFLNEVIKRIEQKTGYRKWIHTLDKIHSSELADVLYEKGYNMPGLSKKDYKKIIRKIAVYIWDTDKDSRADLRCVLPGDDFLRCTVKGFVENKKEFHSLSVSGRKLFADIRKNILKNRLSGVTELLKKKEEQIKRINKELQELEEF